ncbi:MAG: hypothetical protein ABID04_02950, partial [Patescibacteria group bacterium]
EATPDERCKAEQAKDGLATQLEEAESKLEATEWVCAVAVEQIKQFELIQPFKKSEKRLKRYQARRNGD